MSSSNGRKKDRFSADEAHPFAVVGSSYRERTRALPTKPSPRRSSKRVPSSHCHSEPPVWGQNLYVPGSQALEPLARHVSPPRPPPPTFDDIPAISATPSPPTTASRYFTADDEHVTAEWLLEICQTLSSELLPVQLASAIWSAAQEPEEAQQQAALFDVLGEGGMDMLIILAEKLPEIRDIAKSDLPWLDDTAFSCIQMDPDELRMLQEASHAAKLDTAVEPPPVPVVAPTESPTSTKDASLSSSRSSRKEKKPPKKERQHKSSVSSKRRESRSSSPVPPQESKDVARRSSTTAPAGSSSNMDALQNMAAIATATKPSYLTSSVDIESTSPPMRLGWKENLFVVSHDTDESLAPPGTSERRSGAELMDLHQSLPNFSGTTSIPLPPGLKRKNTLIVDREKRHTRWQWNQDLVRNAFRPYRIMLSEQDDLLPDNDEFEAFEASKNAADAEFESVRDAMLEDAGLTEREVAAFFEGFALFNVKIRSLQSQVESLKAVNRAKKQKIKALKRSASVAAPGGGGLLRSRSEFQSNFVAEESAVDLEFDGDTKAPLRMFEESLRALSIRKEKKQHNSNKEVQRLIQELEDAEKKQKKLEKQLQQAGIVIAEDIPYEEAKSQMERIAKRMGEIGSSEVTHPDKIVQASLRQEYFSLEQDMEKYNAALMMTDEYVEEQEELEQKWEDDHVNENLEALKKLRRHMPVQVKSMSEADLSDKPSPNGKMLPKAMAKKFKRTNVLQLIRTDPEDLVRVHPSTLENLRVTGLTLTERRAIYAHIKDIGPRWKMMQADKMTERKWTWFKMMKQNFKENLDQYDHHVAQYGPPGDHRYATRDNPDVGCPFLGKQCPIKADKVMDYDEDYGYTDQPVYEVANVTKADKEDPGAKAKREAMELVRNKKANERSVELKKHYKGKILQVSLANGSCETMDELLGRIDHLQSKWIEERVSSEGAEVTDADKTKELTTFTEALNELKLAVLSLAERSGMQLTGKKDANADEPDKRSPIELGLCEEVYEASADFFDGITERMKELKAKDGRLKSTVEQLRELLDELHERNLATLDDLGVKRPAPSRKRKTREDLTREARARASTANVGLEDADADVSSGRPPAAAMSGRGGLMASIAGRGRGDGATGGRGDLMSAIAGRGRGRGDATGGRGDLMSAIAGRGRGQGDAGGRGCLMAAIAGRGRGGSGRGEAGGRGDLMASIAGRGSGGPGGYVDLMASITASGNGNSSGRGRGASSSGGRGDFLASIAGRGKVE